MAIMMKWMICISIMLKISFHDPHKLIVHIIHSDSDDFWEIQEGDEMED